MKVFISSTSEDLTAPIDLEVLFSARSRAEYESIRQRRALAIQAELVRSGRHRVSIPDLLVAATAAAAGVAWPRSPPLLTSL